MKDRRSESAIRNITAWAREAKITGKKSLEFEPQAQLEGYTPSIKIEARVLKNGNISFHVHNGDESCTFTLNSIIEKRYKARKKK